MKRCVLTVAVLCLLATPAFAQRTSVSRDFPVYVNGGLPDLTVDPKRFVSQMEIVDRYFDPEADACAFAEGVINGTNAGYRRLLRFDTVVMNSGDGDIILGDRADPNNPYAAFFYYAACPDHYHVRDFSTYQLLNLNRTVAAVGHKQGFCLTDSFKYDGGKSNGYDCHYQGITSGWGDWYYKQLVGQWVDITGVPEGDYIVRVTINDAGMVDEGTNRYPNFVETRIHVPNPRNKVTIIP